MDNLNEREINDGEIGFIKKISRGTDEGRIRRSEGKRQLVIDLVIFSIGFILSRCHLLFGAYPVGLAFASVIPVGTWTALFGCAVGSLSMGSRGVIFALVTAISVFLRAALSTGQGDKRIFSESLLLRTSISVLSGFIAAAYEVLTVGLTEGSILYGLSMILLPPTLTFVFSGVFDSSVGIDSVIYGSSDIFSLSKRDERERYNLIFFQISALLFLFFISLSLGEISILGISLSSVFTVIVTLFVAKRFGALRGLAVGFISSLGVSGIYSVSFALMGLGAGLTFSFGASYAVITGGAALSAWSIYSSGLTGFLSTFPEFSIGATLALPLLKKTSEIKPKKEEARCQSRLEDMVGTMALAYQSRYSGNLSRLPSALSELSAIIREYSECIPGVSRESYAEAIRQAEKNLGVDFSAIKNHDALSEKLSLGERIDLRDIEGDGLCAELCRDLADSINREALCAELRVYARLAKGTSADDYELISKLINSAELSDAAERTVDDTLTEELTAAIEDEGLSGGIIRAFGERKKHIILAAEDDGSIISSRGVRQRLEKLLSARLGEAQYFKCGELSLMECEVTRRFSVKLATASLAASEGEVSGDTTSLFETDSDRFYALLSDGMGSGDTAKGTSELVTRFMRCALEVDSAKEAVMYMLNHTIRTNSEECSATVDLFELDLLSGEGVFIKSGAAPSYVKRDTSIFRIKSQTAPIGLLSTIDTEKIKVEVRDGDYIVMLSDGISQVTEESAWLLELLNEPAPKTVKEYADKILLSATENSRSSDDMSVIVIKIEECSK